MTYEDEIDEDEVLDEEGRTRMKLKVGPVFITLSAVDNRSECPQP